MIRAVDSKANDQDRIHLTTIIKFGDKITKPYIFENFHDVKYQWIFLAMLFIVQMFL